MLGFEGRRTYNTLINGKIAQGVVELNSSQNERFNNIKRYWNFYEGYHWEEIPETDGVQLTVNYCKAFVNKYVSFELGNGFTLNTSEKMNNVKVTPEGKTTADYLKSVWKDNGGDSLVNEMGQMKSVTGEAWFHVHYAPVGSFNDPFNIYDRGRVELLLMPTSAVYPDWNPHKRGELLRLLITYQYRKVTVNPITMKREEKFATYKQAWTNDTIEVNDDGEKATYANKYGIIPFVCIKNIPIAGRNEGKSDLEDLIPINTELNMKASDISEIIDYHAAPITVVTGAKIGNLEKGANKVWGGLPKGSTVQNLSLNGDLGASSNYVEFLKHSMCEIGSLPQSALGGAENISNTSGVALHIAQSPLVDLTRMKKNETKRGLEKLNSMILFISVVDGLINRGDINAITNEDFYYNEVTIPDTMPKDELLELQQIQQEFNMGLEDRRGALARLNVNDIDKKIEQIDKDRRENPQLYHIEGNANLNSGFTNGSTAQESVNKEVNGFNKTTSESDLRE